MTDRPLDRDASRSSSLPRRTLLATAALGAVVPVASGCASAEEPRPNDAEGGAGERGSVHRLLAVKEEARDLLWLKQSLQVAVELELATIPVYLCAWWSIRDRNSKAARLINRVVHDEMYHLGVVCNMLVAIGGRPRIKAAACTYPGPLPGGVRKDVTVYLAGLTKATVRDVMMAIEAPEKPLARASTSYPTISAFYTAVLAAFIDTRPNFSPRHQLSEHIGSDTLKPITKLSEVERAIGIIKEQGEGTTASPADAFGDDEPAHYYAFSEIYHERRLRKVGGQWEFTGDAVPFPDARPMGKVPTGGWLNPPEPVRQLLAHCDAAYHSVLQHLEQAWTDGDPRALGAAVHAMRGLEAPAVELMEIEHPTAKGNYGPQFRPPATV